MHLGSTCSGFKRKKMPFLFSLNGTLHLRTAIESDIRLRLFVLLRFRFQSSVELNITFIRKGAVVQCAAVTARRCFCVFVRDRCAIAQCVQCVPKTAVAFAVGAATRNCFRPHPVYTHTKRGRKQHALIQMAGAHDMVELIGYSFRPFLLTLSALTSIAALLSLRMVTSCPSPNGSIPSVFPSSFSLPLPHSKEKRPTLFLFFRSKINGEELFLQCLHRLSMARPSPRRSVVS